MPIPFNEPEKNQRSGVAAWLRFADEEDGRGIRASLFETSGEGKPLAFFFTRIDRYDSSLRRSEIPTEAALALLAGALFRAAAPSPSLLIGADDDLTRQAVAGDREIALSCCLIGPVGATPFSTSWIGEEPRQASEARRLFDEVMAHGAPLEPFDRADDALAEAFADERVQTMASVAGLMNVVSLLSLPERMERPADLPQGPGAALNQPPRVLPLAERLWMKLSAPPPTTISHYERLTCPYPLMPFQKEGIAALLRNDRLLLADDMGLGKTVQAVAAMRVLHSRNEIKSCLVVAPAGLLGQWRRELDRWAPELSAIIVDGSASERSWKWPAKKDVKLVSYDTLRSDFGNNALAPVRREHWDVVVADEAQRVKNRNDTSMALKGLQRTRSWALTGTPIENHEEELASILEFVDYDGGEEPKRYRPGDALRARHRELQLRRRKGDVLDDLPPKQVTMTPIDMHSSQRRSYERAEQEGIVYLKSLGVEVTVQHVFALIMRLKQICNADPQTGESSKLDDIRERIAELAAQGHKALVFSQYVDETSGVAAAAKRLREFSPLCITGDIPPDERQAVIDRFKTNGEHKALVLSLRAGGLGLNLQEASYVFHLDRWWNPAVERQAEDRTHRIGQTVKVNVIKYSCAGTIEERIDKILERKQGLFDQLIDDVSLDLSTQLTREEIFGLFGLERAP